jgi:hypothetical protein
VVLKTPTLDEDDVEDLEEAPDSEAEAAEEQILDRQRQHRSDG